MAPERKLSFGDPLSVTNIGALSVKERFRIPGRGFQVFGEPVHRTFAKYLAGIEPGKSELTKPDIATQALQQEHRGVILLYPVRERSADKVSIGYELFFPKNKIPFDINFTV